MERYYITFDNENYINSVVKTNTDLDTIEFDYENANLEYLSCYKYLNGAFIFDENKKASIQSQREKLIRIEELKKKLVDTDYIYNSIREGGRTEEYYAEVIENRKAWRREIQDLEEELGI